MVARSRGWMGWLAVLALVVALPASAQLPAGFVAKDIGDPGAEGSTVVDAKGVFTMKGSGHDIWDSADDFHFAYTSVTGDGSISARILSSEGGEPTWHKAGVMIRDNDSPGSQNALLSMTSGRGVRFQWREIADEGCAGEEGDILPRVYPVYLRMQRVGNDLTGYASDDGKLWKPITGVRPIAMAEKALFGLAVTSHSTGDITTATFDSLSVQPGAVSVYGMGSCSGDKSVLLTWRPLKNAIGYNIYRGAQEVTADKLVRINTDPVTATSFTDANLVNGTTLTYAVAPVFKGADGNPVEGLLAAVQATPSEMPQGLVGCGINEGRIGGSVLVDAATGEITVRGAGSSFITRPADQLFFAARTMEGDFQITVKALAKPGGHNLAAAGLMVRESLEPTARHGTIILTANSGLRTGARFEPGVAAGHAEILDADTLKVPIVIRLTRKGNTLTPEYSLDDGKTFEAAGDAATFEQDLPKTVYVGLAVASRDGAKPTTGRFSGLEIKKL